MISAMSATRQSRTPAAAIRWARRLGWLPLLLAGAFALAVPEGARTAEAFDFALIGDYPYFPRESVGFPHLVREIREAAELRFVIHLGDIHNPRGGTPCSDELYRARREVFLGLGHPFVLTPGDNDWADCREGSRTPVEHLRALRQVFYADPTHANGDGGFAVRPQSADGVHPELVENVLWEREGVVFATLHMVLPYALPFAGRETEREKERLAAAARDWLESTFAFAAERKARGVFLATQANLWPVSGTPRFLQIFAPGLMGGSDVFDPFKAELAEQVLRFPGPVVLANGDTHHFRVDKPLTNSSLETLETFTRVEGFGSPYGHWVRVRVEPDRPEVFSFRQEIVEANVFTRTPPAERNDVGGDPGLGPLVPIALGYHAIRPYLTALGALTALYWLGRAVRRGVRRLRSG